MTSAAEVTVVLPTRNRPGFLEGALRCVAGQRDVRLEVIVIDEGSTAETATVLARYRNEMDLRVIRHDQPRGVATARNAALADARAEWVAFLDDDDLWAPTWMRTAIDAGRDANAAIVYCGRWLIDHDRRVVGVAIAKDARWVQPALRHTNAIGGPSCVVARRSALEQVGGFDARLSALADWDLWLRLVGAGPAADVADLLVGYTVHQGNMHQDEPLAVLEEFGRFRDLVAARSGVGSQPDPKAFPLWVAGELSRAGHPAQAARVLLRHGLSPHVLVDAARVAWAYRRGRRDDRTGPDHAGPAWLTTRR